MVHWAVFTQISCFIDKRSENSANLIYKTGFGVSDVPLLTALDKVIETKVLVPRE